MTHPAGAVFLALLCALLSAVVASIYIERRNRNRLTLARVDFFAYAASVGGAVSLFPEVLQAFAPELVEPGTLVRAGLDHLDYAAYVLVPIGVGAGLARRWHTILNERASATSAPTPTTN